MLLLQDTDRVLGKDFGEQPVITIFFAELKCISQADAIEAGITIVLHQIMEGVFDVYAGNVIR